MKLFNTNVIHTVKLCQDYFDFDLLSVMTKKQRKTFLAHFDTVEKSSCHPVGAGVLVLI